MKLLKKAYFLWGMVVFAGAYLFLFPFFAIIVQHKSLYRLAFYLNKIWAFNFHLFTLIPFSTEFRGKIDKKRAYVYCPNHTSYLDIPSIGISTKQFVRFVGKNSLSRVPMFGYMFNRLHIPVDRASVKDSYKAFERAKQTIDEGFSVLLYPEGGIRTKKPPNMTKFKDGAFRIAIEKQVPIVPVTILYNWKILFDFRTELTWNLMKVVYHEPIETKGMALYQANELKDKVREVIHQELCSHFPDKMLEEAV